MSTPERALRLLEREHGRRRDAVRLARALSVAVRVEPALLRRVRTVLFPGMDPGVESDLWFGPLVESAGQGGFVLDAGVAEVLRENLAREHRAQVEEGGAPGPSLLTRMERILAEAHAVRFPSIWAEEQATILALRGDPREAIEEALRPAARAMVESDERGMEVARWALRALPRLPAAARRTEAAAMLALGASARLGGRPVAAPPDADGAALSPHLAWTLPPQSLAERTGLSVRLLRGGIEFLPPDPASELPVVSLPRTHPLLVQLSWAGGRKLAHVQPGKTVPLPESVERVTLRTLAGDEYDLLAEGTGAGPGLALDERFAWAVDALVRVGTSEDAVGRVTGWFAAPDRVVTLASPFPGEPVYLHLHWHGRHFPGRVVHLDRDTDLLLLEPHAPPPEVARLVPSSGEVLHEAMGRMLTVLGFSGDRPVSAEIHLGEAYPQGFEVEFDVPEGLAGEALEALAGGPVLVDDVTVGYLSRVGGPIREPLRTEESGRLYLRDTGAVQRLVQQAAETQETQETRRVVLIDSLGGGGRQYELRELFQEVLLQSALSGTTLDWVANHVIKEATEEVPAETWTAIAGADAAVVLADAATLERPEYVPVARFLAWRSRSSQGRFVPVVVVGDSTVPESPRAEPWVWLWPAMTLRGDETGVVATLRERFGAGEPPEPVDPAQPQLAALLSDFPRDQLVEVARSALWRERNREEMEEIPEQEIAFQMIRQGLAGSLDALRELRRRSSDSRRMREIVDLIAATRIAPEAARSLRRAAEHSPGRRLAVMDARSPDTARLVALRARQLGGEWRLVTPREATPEAILRTMQQTWLGNREPDRYLRELESSGTHVVAIVPLSPERSRPWEIEDISKRLPTVTQLIVAPEPSQVAEIRGSLRAELIAPVPDPAQEEEWYRTYRVALDAIGELNAPT